MLEATGVSFRALPPGVLVDLVDKEEELNMWIGEAVSFGETNVRIEKSLAVGGVKEIFGETFRDLACRTGVWCIVCDFDETLFSTSSFHRRSFERVLNEFGVKESIPSSYVRLLRGKGDFAVFNFLLSIAKSEYPEMTKGMPSLALLPDRLSKAFPGLSYKEQMDQCVEMRRTFLLQAVEENLPEKMPGLDSFVSWMRSNDVVCGIASSSPDSFVEAVMRGREIDDVFPMELVVGSQTVESAERQLGCARGSLAKPNLYSVYLAAEKISMMIGMQRRYYRNNKIDSGITYLGDSETDCVLASQDAGLVVMGIIINRERKEEFKRKFSSLTFVDSLEDLVR